MSAIVLLVYLGFLIAILVGNTTKGFFALLMGTILFPCCALFYESPSISGQIVLLYAFIGKEYVMNTHEFKKALSESPLKLFLLLVAFSYALTTVFNFSAMNAYYAIRDMVDLYCYFIAASIASRKLTLKAVSESMYWFVFFMCLYGLYEAATNTNILYKVINLAFPAHDGWYNLNSSINASEGWRIRTIITTKHPTTLGTLLMVLFMFYWNAFQSKTISYMKNIAILVLLGLNVILSGSRTSLACVVIVLLYSYMKTKGALMKIFFVGILIFSASYMVSYTVEHLLDNKDGSSIMLRMTQLAFSLEKIKESPIWGNGSNYTAHQIKDEGVRFNDDDEFIGGLESVAFIYLIDRGLLGVVTFYLFWLMAFLYLRKNDALFEERGVTMEIMPMGIILFLTMSGLIGNNTAFCFLFSGLYIGCIEKKRLEREEKLENEKNAKKTADAETELLPETLPEA